MKMVQSVPKRLHIKFRRRGITQKKTYNTFHLGYKNQSVCAVSGTSRCFFFQINTKHIIQCGQNVQLLIVKPVGASRNEYALKG